MLRATDVPAAVLYAVHQSTRRRKGRRADQGAVLLRTACTRCTVGTAYRDVATSTVLQKIANTVAIAGTHQELKNLNNSAATR